MQRLIQRIFGRGKTSSILPPIQNGQPLHFYPEPLPNFRFGVASLTGSKSDRKLQIEISYPQLDIAKFPQREVITDTYIVQVPEFAGDRPVDVNLEERTRRCEIAIHDEGTANTEEDRLQYYVIGVPYTEFDDEGIARNRSRIEIRKRKAFPAEVAVGFTPRIVRATHDLNVVECYSRKKKRLTPKQILRILKRETPVLLVNDLRFITNYFQRLLAPDTIIVVDNGSGVAVD